MSVELIKESVRAVQVIGEETTRTVVENDIIVPDIKPDISHILLLDGDVIVKNTDVSQDRITIHGSIQYKILYLPEDRNYGIKSINTACDFSYSLDAPGARQGMKCKPRCYLDHLENSILNGRKINVKAIVSLQTKVTNEENVDITTGIEGLDNIQVLKNNANLNSYAGTAQSECVIKEIIEIPSGKPAIKEILRNDVKITNKEYDITENKVIVKGDLNISTLYASDDENGTIQYMEHEIPFSHLIDFEGINENSACGIDYNIAETAFEPAEDSDGELKMLNCDVTLNVSASAFDKKVIQTIDDAYSPSARISFERKSLQFEDVLAENNIQLTAKESIPIEENEPEVSEIFNVICKPSLADCTIDNEKVTLEGVVSTNILYLTGSGEQPVYCKTREIPFKQALEVKGIKDEMKIDTQLDVEHCSYNIISSGEVDIRITLNANVKVNYLTNLPIIVKAVDNPVEDKKRQNASIIIYFAQPNDNLWKIAKKYLKTVDEIKNLNNIEDNEPLAVGQQILIPR